MDKVKIQYDSRFPSIDDLRNKAKKRIPKFAFEYLDGGCNEDINLDKNRKDIQRIELMPKYIDDHLGINMQTELFGQTYDAPIGIAPIGLQGLMWPGATEILAKAAFDHNIPFVLSTVATASIETVAELTEGKAWFQLYHPADPKLRIDLLNRATDVEMPVLVILADVPAFGHRPRDIRNGLSMPPKMNLSNVLQVIRKPNWALRTLANGQPSFATLKPYMPKNLDLSQLGKFMNDTFSGWLNEERIAPIRDQWKGKLVIKGVVNELDAEKAVRLGLDGIIVSNHGGRQLDAGQSSIVPMTHLASKFKDKLKVMVDSGLRGGPDVARAMASGADFTFLGRSFMYGVSALGSKGGNHTISLLKTELEQVMQQLCCSKVQDFPNHLIE
ncbi:MAG: alpha-hydroxy-acid oxidizing protein [Reichenbachiella sp.]